MGIGFAKFILRNKITILLSLLVFSIFYGLNIKKLNLAYSEAQLLPAHDSIAIKYKAFRKTFGQEDNMVVLGFELPKTKQAEFIKNWEVFANQLKNEEPVEALLSFTNLPLLAKDTIAKKFTNSLLYSYTPKNDTEVKPYLDSLQSYPFYEGLLYNKEHSSFRMVLFLNPDFIDTKGRVEWVKELQERVRVFEEQNNNNDVKISGVPVIRTMNSASIQSEMGFFVLLALLITATIFYFFFRSFIATLVAVVVVTVGVTFSFATIGALDYQITVLTALIPPLIIVIGIPNCIYIINKYQQEYKLHANRALSLVRTIKKVGLATLSTNITTAFGFFTFIFTDSEILREFGVVASINIMGVFVFSILIIPSLYALLPEPKKRHLKHLDKSWADGLADILISIVDSKKNKVYIISLILLIISGIGISKMYTSGGILDDLPKGEQFYDDILYFDKEFKGVLPLEIYIEHQKKTQITSNKTLKNLNKLQNYLDSLPQSATSISYLNLVKFSRQAFYNGVPEFYGLPDKLDKTFILDYARQNQGQDDLLKNYIAEDGKKIRVTSLIQNMETDEMEGVFEKVSNKLEELFPKKTYNSFITGGAFVFYKGTHYLTKNLLLSLGLAICIIGLVLSLVFRSWSLIIIGMVPNLFPLLLTAGLMGYFDIPIKPSTLLVFSVAFGISVDDTIHYLAKFKQELNVGKPIVQAVYGALRETGLSMFYTSIVLFFGFLCFTFSSFGGTKALGGLISITLLIAMFSNLVILPCLICTFERFLNQKHK